MRADERLVRQGLVPSRARAQAEIRAGTVILDGRVVAKPSQDVAPDAELAIASPENPWVSRGGLKLARALDVFGIDAAGAVALDVGASTGGFTEVLLARGAHRVYAVDVGRGQLHERLRAEPRVVSLEAKDARALTHYDIPESVDIIVADVSFISLRLVLPAAVQFAKPSASLIALVKPQFEAGPGAVRKGIIKDAGLRSAAVEGLSRVVQDDLGWQVLGCAPSPVKGGDGNEEFLLAAARP